MRNRLDMELEIATDVSELELVSRIVLGFVRFMIISFYATFRSAPRVIIE